jgi:hypothetical protein
MALISQTECSRGSGPTDLEFSCEHPPMEPNEEEMLDGRREVAENDARVIVS